MTTLITPKSDAQVFADRVMGMPAPMEVFGNRVLVAKYIRTTVGSTGRILAANETQREDRWQGKVGLVVSVGPLAFVNDAVNDFCGQKVKPGDWVLFNYSDGADFDYHPGVGDKVPCKLIKDVEIHGVVSSPEMVW